MNKELNLQSLKELFKNKSAQGVLVGMTLVMVLAASMYLTSTGTEKTPSSETQVVQAELKELTKPAEEEIVIDPIENKNVEDTSRFKSRDIFQALVTPTQSADIAPVAGQVNTSPTSAYEYEGKTNTPANTTGTGTATSSVSTGTGTSALPITSMGMPWMRLEALSDKLAVVRFDRKGDGSDIILYELEPGEKFEENYMIVSLSGSGAVIWKGDERIELKLDEAYYIQ